MQFISIKQINSRAISHNPKSFLTHDMIQNTPYDPNSEMQNSNNNNELREKMESNKPASSQRGRG